MSAPIRVLIGGDQRGVREGLTLVPSLVAGVEVVGTAANRSVLDALSAGARGYLTKDASGDNIRQALRRVVDDQAAIDPGSATPPGRRPHHYPRGPARAVSGRDPESKR
jgi:hypothetical protein